MFVPFVVETTGVFGRLRMHCQKTLVAETFWPWESDCLTFTSHSMSVMETSGQF